MRLQVYNFYWINYAKSKKEMILNEKYSQKWKQNEKRNCNIYSNEKYNFIYLFLHHLSLSDLKCNTFRMYINFTMCMWARYNNKNRKRKAFAVGFEYIGFSWFFGRNKKRKKKIKIKNWRKKNVWKIYIIMYVPCSLP